MAHAASLTLEIALWLGAAGWLAVWLAVEISARRLPHPTPSAPPPSPGSESPSAPLVSVIIPARNEQALIERCLRSVLDQDYAPFEVVVIDDGSTDQTPAILERVGASDQRLRVVRGQPLPEGWAGKCFALHQAAGAARGDWLLFTDADAVLAPGALRATVEHALGERADLLTGLPLMRCASFWESVLQPFMAMLILLAFDPRKVHDPGSDIAVGAGPFLFFRRRAYEDIGGHANLRGEVVEDLGIARLTKSAGFRLRVMGARRLMTVARRLTFAGLCRGWTRVIYAGLGRRPGAAALAVAALLWFAVAPYLLALYGLAAGHGAVALPALVGIAATTGVRLSLRLHYGVEIATVLLTPVAASLAAWLMVRSARHFKGPGIDWSGRIYLNQDRPKNPRD